MNPDDDFYLYLPSNANSELCRFNKPNAFTIIIDQAFKLEGSWDVALWSISLSSRPMKQNQANPVDLQPLQSLMIYSDIVTDSSIAGRVYPLLALVPGSTSGLYQPTNLQYHRVRPNLTLKDVSIKLQDLSGSPVEFTSADSGVVVELHFKRRTI